MEMLKIKLDEGAKFPIRGTKGSAGLDLFAMKREYNGDEECWVYHTGVHMEIPEGWVGLVFCRSSICKKNIAMRNCVGVIDSDYRGEILVKFYNLSGEHKVYDVGERVAQLVITPCFTGAVEVVDSLSDTERGEGGHGSTGK